MKAPRSYPLVAVTWEDAARYTTASLTDLEGKDLVTTYGALICSDKDYHIVMTHSADENNSDYTKIPSVLVRNIVRLRVTELPKRKKRRSRA
jgi:hypothetical protein